MHVKVIASDTSQITFLYHVSHITVLHYYYHTSHIMHRITLLYGCHPLHNFISKISIEIPYRAALCAVKCAELSSSGSARVRLPLVAVRSEHAVALYEWHTFNERSEAW